MPSAHNYIQLSSLPEDVRQQVLDFETALKSGQAKVTMDIMRFLKDWLEMHIKGTDKKYGPFFNSKGLR